MSQTYSVETPVFVRGHYRFYRNKGYVWIRPHFRRLPSRLDINYIV